MSHHEDGNIIAQFLRQIKTWCRYFWNLRYVITDNSAAEQRAVKLAFPGLIVTGEIEVSHFLCRIHSERTLNRTLVGDKCKEARRHLYSALYYRKTSMGCEDSINLAIQAASTHKKAYLKREWLNNKYL